MKKTFLLVFTTVIICNCNAQWATIAIPGAGKIESMKFVSPMKGFALSFSAFLVTSNGGMAWTTTPVSGWRYLDFIDSLNGYADGVVGIIRKTINGGATWTNLTPPQSNSLWGVSMVTTSLVYFASTGGLVFKTDNGGATFSVLTVASSTVTLTDIYFTNPLNGCATGSGGSIYKTSNGGILWTTVYSTPVIAGLNDIDFVNANVGFAVGSSGSIAKTTNGGNSWNTQNAGTLKDLKNVHFFDINNGIIVGDSGTVLRTLNGGNTWFGENIGTNSNLYSATLLSSTSAVIGGSDAVYKNTNLALGINELYHENYIKFFPNPSNGTFTISFDQTVRNALMKIFNLFGEEVYSEQVNGKFQRINSKLSPGLYLMSVRDGERIMTRKIIIQ